MPDAGFQDVNLARGVSKGRPLSTRHAWQGPPEAPAGHGPPAAPGTSWACAACAPGGSWACPSWARSARAAFGIRWGRLGADKAPAGGSASSTGAASISRRRLGTGRKGGIWHPLGPAVQAEIGMPGRQRVPAEAGSRRRQLVPNEREAHKPTDAKLRQTNANEREAHKT